MEILLGHEFRIGNIVEYCNQLAFIKSISRDNVTLDHYDEVIVNCKYNLAPLAEMLRYDEPEQYANSLDEVIDDLVLYVLRDKDICGAQDHTADAVMRLRELRDAFRRMAI